jgi:hypothetical protein
VVVDDFLPASLHVSVFGYALHFLSFVLAHVYGYQCLLSCLLFLTVTLFPISNSLFPWSSPIDYPFGDEFDRVID